MKRSMVYLFMVSAFCYISSCGNKTSINNDEASSVISDYIHEHPDYRTGSFKFGEIKFRGKKDIEDLNKYKTLADLGYITMNLQEQKKAFLAKDSSYVYQITLTEKAAPLVLNQGKDKANVKMINYILDDNKPVDFVKINDKSAKVTVTLKKETTDFYPFDNGHRASSEFITKTYKLRHKKDAGWVISKEN